MNRKSIGPGSILIRDTHTDDIGGITALVKTCGPYLTKHGDYLYFVYSRCFSQTCAVAVENGRIIGWCSTLHVSEGNYFVHQLGVAPEARGRHVAFQLFAYLLCKLRVRHGDEFRLQFTTDRRNATAHRLNRKIAESFHMCLRKLPEEVPFLEDGGEEELYEMTPLRQVELVATVPEAQSSELQIPLWNMEVDHAEIADQ